MVSYYVTTCPILSPSVFLSSLMDNNGQTKIKKMMISIYNHLIWMNNMDECPLRHDGHMDQNKSKWSVHSFPTFTESHQQIAFVTITAPEQLEISKRRIFIMTVICAGVFSCVHTTAGKNILAVEQCDFFNGGCRYLESRLADRFSFIPLAAAFIQSDKWA